MFPLHWVCVGNWNCRVLALRKDSAKAFVHAFALHFLMEHNGAWCTYDRVLPTRWCKHAKISQKWKHQNWIKWAYISPSVNSRVNKCLTQTSQSQADIFLSRFLRAVVPVVLANQRRSFQLHVITCGFSQHALHWSRNLEHLAPRAFSFEESCSWHGGHL